MPPLWMPSLVGVKNEQGEEMFTLIVGDALLAEAQSDLIGHVGHHHSNQLHVINTLDFVDSRDRGTGQDVVEGYVTGYKERANLMRVLVQ